MEFLVQRVCERGKPMAQHRRLGGQVRRMLRIKQEVDETRRRTVLVARVVSTEEMNAIPALFDVSLISSTGECWTLAGYEKVIDGPLGDESMMAQSWLLELAAQDDLFKAEIIGTSLARERRELMLQLQALRRAKGDSGERQSALPVAGKGSRR